MRILRPLSGTSLRELAKLLDPEELGIVLQDSFLQHFYPAEMAKRRCAVREFRLIHYNGLIKTNDTEQVSCYDRLVTAFRLSHWAYTLYDHNSPRVLIYNTLNRNERADMCALLSWEGGTENSRKKRGSTRISCLCKLNKIHHTGALCACGLTRLLVWVYWPIRCTSKCMGWWGHSNHDQLPHWHAGDAIDWQAALYLHLSNVHDPRPFARCLTLLSSLTLVPPTIIIGLPCVVVVDWNTRLNFDHCDHPTNCTQSLSSTGKLA